MFLDHFKKQILKRRYTHGLSFARMSKGAPSSTAYFKKAFQPCSSSTYACLRGSRRIGAVEAQQYHRRLARGLP
jgi:hypothetical protein